MKFFPLPTKKNLSPLLSMKIYVFLSISYCKNICLSVNILQEKLRSLLIFQRNYLKFVVYFLLYLSHPKKRILYFLFSSSLGIHHVYLCWLKMDPRTSEHTYARLLFSSTLIPSVRIMTYSSMIHHNSKTCSAAANGALISSADMSQPPEQVCGPPPPPVCRLTARSRLFHSPRFGRRSLLFFFQLVQTKLKGCDRKLSLVLNRQLIINESLK